VPRRLVKNDILPPLEFSDFEQCRECIKGKYTKQNKKGPASHGWAGRPRSGRESRPKEAVGPSRSGDQPNTPIPLCPPFRTGPTPSPTPPRTTLAPVPSRRHRIPPHLRRRPVTALRPYPAEVDAARAGLATQPSQTAPPYC
jgi:hypothetical protein